MERIIALVALLTFGGFLGILLFEVPRLDLILIIGFVALLAAIDFYRSTRNKRD